MCVCVCVCSVCVCIAAHTKLASVYNAQYNTVYTATQHMCGYLGGHVCEFSVNVDIRYLHT